MPKTAIADTPIPGHTSTTIAARIHIETAIITKGHGHMVITMMVRHLRGHGKNATIRPMHTMTLQIPTIITRQQVIGHLGLIFNPPSMPPEQNLLPAPPVLTGSVRSVNENGTDLPLRRP